MGVSMQSNSQWRGYIASVLSILFGSVVWFAFRKITGEHDPQGHIDYWKYGYPILVLGAGILSFFFTERPWRWAAYIILMQVILGLTLARGDLNLLPIGLIFHAIITIPAVISGYFGAWLRKRITPSGRA
jgi:uncharacterized membrane protein YfcA